MKYYKSLVNRDKNTASGKILDSNTDDNPLKGSKTRFNNTVNIVFRAKKMHTKKEMKPYEMQKGREPLRSHVITQPWELSVSQEEIRVNSDDSYESVMHLATSIMQAYEMKAFLINSLKILEIAIQSKASERETLTRLSKLAEGMLLSQDTRIHIF